MKLISFKSHPAYQFGHVAEVRVAELLQSYGAYIIPSYAYSGSEEKAPKLNGIDHGFVIPDLDVALKTRVWVEVKRKTSPSFYRKTQDWVHGIPLRHYNDYLQVERITHCDVWIVFSDEHNIRCGRLAEIPIHHTYPGDKMSRGGMVFFNVLDLQPLEVLINEVSA